MTHFGKTRAAVIAVAATLMLSASASAQSSERAVFTFSGSKSGAVGSTQLVADSAGNLYGTTISGGTNSSRCIAYTGVPGCGVVFKLTPAAQGPWVETVLYTFTGGKDGGVPTGGVVLDSAGNLYGTTRDGGDTTASNCAAYSGSPAGCGLVYELTPTAQGPWTETVLHTFTGGSDGAWPFAGVILDASGNIYGSTGQGGNVTCSAPYGCGVVFKLTPAVTGPWPESVLYAFNDGTDGFLPYGGLTFDPRGNLYGVTYLAGDTSASCFGNTGCGVVFELSPMHSGPWKESTLHAFTGGADGGVPLSGVTLDAHANVYGTTLYGGDSTGNNCLGGYGYNAPPGCGVVFKLTPNKQALWEENVLYSFTGADDGAFVGSPVVLDRAGNLYSEASGGNASSLCPFGNVLGCGVVFKLTRDDSSPWTESVLYAFMGGIDGGAPESNLLLDRKGFIYGITEAGGDTSQCTGNVEGEAGCGVVFEIK